MLLANYHTEKKELDKTHHNSICMLDYISLEL